MSARPRLPRGRLARRHRAQAGMTLIELLLAMALMAIITTFLAGGLAMARRSFETDRAAGVAIATDDALQSLARLVATAMPLKQGDFGKAAMLFEGRSQTLSFVALGEGHGLRGGLHLLAVSLKDGELIVASAPARLAGSRLVTADPAPPVTLASGVSAIRLSYFGLAPREDKPAWRKDWERAPALPQLVSLQIDFADPRRAPATTVMPLRQR